MLTEVHARLNAERDRLATELGDHSGPERNVDVPESHSSAASPDRVSLLNRVRQIEQLIEAFPEVERASISYEGAGFGSTVELLDLDDGASLVFTILAGQRIDPDRGEISLASPIGHALVGRHPGDEVEVITPRGNRRFRVVAVTTLPFRLGIVEDGVRMKGRSPSDSVKRRVAKR